ncbi:DNA-methyltransferase [Caballeronia sp. DA-9]|uniref:DNA-methyltransferase n=1 Tax=Caballeronia sp. DA-9 TaxID=3436237 RepID=UPI003F67CDCC
MKDWTNACHFGDCRDTMRAMIADGVKVQTIVTSPPYWGLRDYGVDGQIGHEPTLREFIETLTDVFELCRELLADDGTAWVNMGDSYAGSWGSQGRDYSGVGVASLSARQVAASQRKASGTGTIRDDGIKAKDLMGQPWRLAFALQDAGWYLRQDIIWHKPNPMPESTRDRCTKAHEYLFLLSKKSKYFYDNEAIRTPSASIANYKMPDGWDTAPGAHGSYHPQGREKGRTAGNVNPPKGAVAYAEGDERHRTKAGLLAFAEKTRASRDNFKREDSKRAVAHPGQTMGTHRPDRADSEYDLTTANRRSVWTIATEAYPGAHFATFPEALVEPCVLAGSRPGDIVFDPFFGSGTTGAVASRLGRRWIGCELNPAYEPLQRDRLRQPGLMLENA